MPSSKRDRIKRKHTAAINALVDAQKFLGQLYDMFLPVHPKYAEGYQAIATMIQHEIELVEQMKSFI